MVTFPAGYTSIPAGYTGLVWIEGQMNQLEQSLFGEDEVLSDPVRVLCVAQYAYAGIFTNKRNLDVQLSHGKSAEASLLEEAESIEQAALRQLSRARVMRKAAKSLLNQKAAR